MIASPERGGALPLVSVVGWLMKLYRHVNCIFLLLSQHDYLTVFPRFNGAGRCFSLPSSNGAPKA